jgi:hypothetical protein
VLLDPDAGAGFSPLRWVTMEKGQRVEFDTDPDVDAPKRLRIQLLSLLPLDSML